MVWYSQRLKRLSVAIIAGVAILGVYITLSVYITKVIFPVRADEKKYEFTINDNHKDAKIAIRDRIIIKLPVQLGTGYRWEIAQRSPVIDGPENRLEAGGAPGSIEQQVFEFRASRVGMGKLVFNYLRPWQRNEPPANTFELGISVAPK